MQSHFDVQPNYSVDAVLGCHWGCDNVQFSVVQSNTKNLLCPYITLCVLHVSLDKNRPLIIEKGTFLWLL